MLEATQRDHENINLRALTHLLMTSWTCHGMEDSRRFQAVPEEQKSLAYTLDVDIMSMKLFSCL